jgi:myo-inositol-1(or 4)-monophosphatase
VADRPFARELAFAVSTAREAGEVLRRHYGAVRDVQFKSSAVDPVTEADKASEALIAARLRSAFPDDRLLAEEGSGAEANTAAERVWIVDPLDGTANFMHGYPVFCVSIALHLGGQTVVGVVYDPLRDELFTAVRGQGAHLNGAPMSVSPTGELIRAMLCTGFAYDLDWRAENLPYWERFIALSQGVRRDGSAALDVAYVAAGRLDGYWERGIAPWDIAAGVLLVSEAGGAVTDYHGRPAGAFTREIVASNGALHPRMLDVIADVAARQPARDLVDFV